MHHGLSIGQKNSYWGFNTRHYTIVCGFCLSSILMVGKRLTYISYLLLAGVYMWFFCATHISAVQILFVPERRHWIATAYRDGKVLVYDSLFPGRLAPSTEEQLVRLYQPAVRDSCLAVTVVPFQQHEGGAECGLFSIAVSLCCG